MEGGGAHSAAPGAASPGPEAAEPGAGGPAVSETGAPEPVAFAVGDEVMTKAPRQKREAELPHRSARASQHPSGEALMTLRRLFAQWSRGKVAIIAFAPTWKGGPSPNFPTQFGKLRRLQTKFGACGLSVQVWIFRLGFRPLRRSHRVLRLLGFLKLLAQTSVELSSSGKAGNLELGAA